MDQASAAKNELKDALTEVAGKEKQEILMNGIGDYDCFGAFGSMDIRLIVLPMERVVKYEYFRAGSDNMTRFGEVPFGDFHKLFGDTFDFGNLR